MRFWWGQKEDEKRTHWIRWQDLCKPKWEGGLGLRDLEAFNKALLAKQGWRLVQNSESLLAQTLKARYFPNGDFMSASVGYNSSYTWQSMVEGRRVLQVGLVWVIGNGQNVRIWKDPWIVGGANTRVQSANEGLNEDASVRELMMDDFSKWDSQLVRQIFSQEEARLILQLPFSSARLDRLTWGPEKSGRYTTKSGYVEWMKNENRAFTSPGDARWKWVWCLSITPKIRLFMWRVMRGILPTTLNLITRFVNVDPECKRCGLEFESIEHALRDCPKLAECWSLLNFAIPVPMEGEPMDEWIMRCKAALREEEIELVVTVLWSIWFGRNEGVFKGSFPAAVRTIGMARRHLEDYRAASFKAPVPLRRTGDERWKRPEVGWVKLNTDASCVQDEETGVGGVLRTETGTASWVFAQRIPAAMTVDVAEAQAVLVGVRCAVEKGARRVIVEMDSQSVYFAIMKNEANLSYLGGIVTDILDACRRFEAVSFRWIRRSSNSVAHLLARYAFMCDSFYFSHSIPEAIVNALDADFMA